MNLMEGANVKVGRLEGWKKGRVEGLSSILSESWITRMTRITRIDGSV